MAGKKVSIFESVNLAQKIERAKVDVEKKAIIKAQEVADAQTQQANFLIYLKEQDFRIQHSKNNLFNNYFLNDNKIKLKLVVDLDTWIVESTIVNMEDHKVKPIIVEYDIVVFRNDLGALKEQLEAILIDIQKDNSFDVLKEVAIEKEIVK